MRLHKRQTIREAVRERLLGRTVAQDRVHAMRFTTYRGLDLPALGIYVTEESVDPSSKGGAPRYLWRTMQLTLEAVVKYDSQSMEADLDAIALEVERAMHIDRTIGDTASDAILASTELDVLIEGDRIVGVARLTYSVTYETSAPEAEDVTLDDLKTVDVKTNLGGAVAAGNQAEDKVEGLDQ